MFATAQDERIYDEAEYVASEEFYAWSRCESMNSTDPFSRFMVQRVEQTIDESVFYLWAVVDREVVLPCAPTATI
jgi:hypothetical protein